MLVGIDASNIRSGGGISPLKYLLVTDLRIHKVIIWGCANTLKQIDNNPSLIKSHQKLLDKSLFHRIFWQRFRLSNLARKAGCDVLFVPGGSYVGNFSPIVTLSQNLLPFEWRELKRFGWSWMGLKLIFLHISQRRTFSRAAGVIFLTQYARDVVMSSIKTIVGKSTIIPHGIDASFIRQPRPQLSLSSYSYDKPFKILYVSIIDVYKHQWHAVKAVAYLRSLGLPVILDLVGPAYKPAFNKLQKTLKQLDPNGEFIHYHGAVTGSHLSEIYFAADLFLFASSCENLPIILLEAMASGLPIACSNRGPMPEVLGDAGVYFDPEDVQGMIKTLQELLASPDLRATIAQASFLRAKSFSCPETTKRTFKFLSQFST